MRQSNFFEKISRHSHTCECDNCECESLHNHEAHGHKLRNFDTVIILRLSISAVLFISGLLLKSETLETVFMAAAALIAGYDIIIGAVINLFKRRTFDENLLMTIAAAAAFSVAEGHEGAAVMILFQTGEMLQDYALNKTRREITRLTPAGNGENEATSSETDKVSSKNRSTEKLITSFAKIYTPIVLALAVIFTLALTFAAGLPLSESLNRALVFLVIACPCALVISIPLTYFAGIGGASKLGILFKSSEAMRAAANAASIVFDESVAPGSGNLLVNSVKSDRMDTGMMLKVAAHIEAFSDHRIAKAIKASYGGFISPELVNNYEEYHGEGVRVTAGGIRLSLGSREFIERQNIPIDDDEAEDCAVYMSVGDKYAGMITLTREITDNSLAHDLEEKKNGAGKKGTLIFVRSGAGARVTDEADITIALGGGAGGDIVIADKGPGNVALAVQSAKRTKVIVYQNICFALGIKLAVLVLGAFGISPLWFAVFADVGVTLLAIINSMRAFYIRPPKHKEGEPPLTKAL